MTKKTLKLLPILAILLLLVSMVSCAARHPREPLAEAVAEAAKYSNNPVLANIINNQNDYYIFAETYTQDMAEGYFSLLDYVKFKGVYPDVLWSNAQDLQVLIVVVAIKKDNPVLSSIHIVANGSSIIFTGVPEKVSFDGTTLTFYGKDTKGYLSAVAKISNNTLQITGQIETGNILFSNAILQGLDSNYEPLTTQ